MSLINVTNLTFAYDGSYDNIFENVCFQIDTDWKLGFTGRNGRGKTTFLNLLLGKLEYSGNISAQVSFDYFPFHVENKLINTLDVINDIFPYYIHWKLLRELSLLKVSEDVLYRPFDSLSRMPTYMNGNETGLLIEACAGLLDKDSPEDCIRRETEEETGYRVTNVHKVGEAYMSPGSVTEILYFFVAEYTPHMHTGQGGGVEKEQEEIEVLELPFGQALNMAENGEIRDAKTIMLLQYAQLHGLLHPVSKPQHILIAGPYRSNTGDDSALIGANMRQMNETALRVYEMGHMPVLGEWYALPLMETAGSRQLGDETFERIFHSSAVRLLSHCDAVLRIGGPSKGADEMVRTAEAKGKRVYRDLGEIPVLVLGQI